MNLTRKEYANADELRKYRRNIVQETIKKGGKADRVPTLSQAWTWKFIDAGYSLRDCLYDYDKCYDAVCEHHEKYDMDLYIDYGTRNPLRVTDCYGSSRYTIDDEKNYLSIKDCNLMDEDDYDNFINDGPLKYLFERAVPFAYGITDPEDMIQKYGKAAREYNKFVAFNDKITKQYLYGYGVPSIGLGKLSNPMDWMVHGLRGLKGTAIDMRKRHEKLEKAINVLSEFLYPAITKAINNYNPEDDRYATFARITSLSHTILNAKQFEQFCWPYFKKFCEDVATRGWYALLFFEGSVMHIKDYLCELSEGHFVLLFEQDNPVEVKKALPNLTLAGGFPVGALQNKTKEECVDIAKKLLDDMAYNGKYIFSTDKMMSFPQDGKGENYKAVVDFVKEYGKY